MLSYNCIEMQGIKCQEALSYLFEIQNQNESSRPKWLKKLVAKEAAKASGSCIKIRVLKTS